MNDNFEDFFNKLYVAFNDRNIDLLKSFLHKDVHWPNGWEGGYIDGKDAVIDYWQRQWKELDPNVLPVSFKKRENKKIEVMVHQKIKDMDGNLLLDTMVKHIYAIKDNLVESMEIEETK